MIAARRRRWLADALLATASAVAALALTASPAAGHAELETTSPADGARLDAPPTEIVLTFTEPVSAPPGGVRVVDASGQRVDNGTVDVEGRTLRVRLESDLEPGTYVVSWRAISEDSHPIRGAFVFGVGADAALDADTVASLVEDESDAPWEVAGAVARFFAYVGALVAAGGALYLAIVDEQGGRRLTTVVLAAALTGVVGLAATVPIQAALATGFGIGALTRAGVPADVLADGFGAALVVSALGLAVVAVALGRRGAIRRVGLVAGGAAAVGGFAVSGHTTTTDPVWLASTADVVHIAAGAAWFGGLAALLIGLLRRREPPLAATIVARFSRVAAAAIVGIGAAGIALAWGEVRSFDALTSTTYGRLLIVKVAIVAAVGVVGLYNRARLVPALATAADGPRARRLLTGTVALEVVALVVALALTAVLVNVTPARAARRAPFSTTEAFGNGSLNLVVDPPEVGFTSIHAYVLDGRGQPVVFDDDATITITLEHTGRGIGPIEREPFDAGPGHFQLDTNDLSVAGTWTITVSARLSRFEVRSARVEVPIRG